MQASEAELNPRPVKPPLHVWSKRQPWCEPWRCVQASEASRAAHSSREEVVELRMAAQAKDKENAKLWEQARLAWSLLPVHESCVSCAPSSQSIS